MRPVQHFKSNFALPANKDIVADSQAEAPADSVQVYDDDSAVRNLCFVWKDGRKAFFNYAYLVSVDLVLEDRLNVMLLYFSGQVVTLKGSHLELLFDLLLDHIPKTITATNSRYYIGGQMQAAVVFEIIVKSE